MGKVAWVAGASGLIGGHLMRRLTTDDRYDRVIALVRKPTEADWAKNAKADQWLVDYDDLLDSQAPCEVDDAFCALGSTSKKTPDKTTYRTIDVTYPTVFADLAIKHGARFYGLVSAHGANASSLSFYLNMKGELEDNLRQRAFKSQAFARPSLLKGDRDEFRPLEHLSEWFMNLMPGNYKAIDSADVAAALIRAANSVQSGVQVLSSQSMQNAATALR